MIEGREIPKGWEVVRLDEVCSFEYGKALKAELRNKEGKFPVLGSNGFVGFHDSYLVNGPGIVIGRKGAAGEISFVAKNFWPIDTTYFLKLSQNLSLLYFYFLLKTLRLNQFEKSTAIPGLNRNDAYEQKIPLPPLPEQHRIVAKIEELFSSLDKGIESLKTAQQQLKVYRQAVLKWAFEGKLTNKDVVEGHLPEGWKWVKIDYFLSDKKKGMATGPFGMMLKKGEHQNNGVPVLGIENIGEGVFQMPNKIFITSEKAEELNSFRVKANDIIISRSGTVGEICLVPEKMGGSIISTNLIKVSINRETLNPKYFVYLFQGGKVRQEVFNLCKGSSRAFLNQTILKSLDFPYCPLPEQRAIVAEIESRLSVCDKIEESIGQTLKQGESLRQSILKKAFEGKLVPQDPKDEPASVLLDRIRRESDETLSSRFRKVARK
jgi:type I restriction enzyme, S subunit